MRISSQTGFSLPIIILLLLALAGIGGAGYYVVQKNQDKDAGQSDQQKTAITNYDECVAAGNPVMDSFPEQCSANGQTFVNSANASEDGWSQPVTSGKGGFSVAFPSNWGKILKPLDADWFLIPGQNQPAGNLEIQAQDSFGSDGGTVFSVHLGNNFADPAGNPEDYTLTNGKENPIKGKKYTKIYEKDEKVGIGIQRFKGDRDYEYAFKLDDNRELRVFYAVYGSDPSNKLVTVEAIVESIRLNP